MTWLYERPESVLRLTRELEGEVQMLLIYLTMKGKAIATRDKKRIEERIRHILFAELPYSPYTGNH